MKRTNCLILAVTTVLLAACGGGGGGEDVRVDCTSYSTSNSVHTTCRQTDGYTRETGTGDETPKTRYEEPPQQNNPDPVMVPHDAPKPSAPSKPNTDYEGIPLPDAPPTTKVTEPQVDFMAYLLSAPASDTHLCSATLLEVQGIGMQSVTLVEAGNHDIVYAKFEIERNATYASASFDPTVLPNGTMMVQIIASGSGKTTVVMPTREWHQSYKIWPCDSPGRQTAGN